MNDHDGCIILNMLNGIGGISAWKRRGSGINALIKACGSVSAVFELDAASVSRIGGINAEQAERLSRWRDYVDPEDELERAKRDGVTVLCRTDDEYPASLRDLLYPPLCVYLLGTLPVDLAVRSVAIIGTRRPTEFGIRMARDFSASAVRCGWTTVSGLAAGIDAAAHQSTVEAGGKTVAVLGSGIGRAHRDKSAELVRDIVRSGGAVVSEYPMNTESTRCTLPRRNRIIAGLSRCTLVVEAGENSGALITATCASDAGRRVFAVRGEEDNPVAFGSNMLIRQGAKSVTEFRDILDGI